MIFSLVLTSALLAMQAATTPPDPSLHAPGPAEVEPTHCGLDASGKYYVGCGVTPPRALSELHPQFSREARKLKISGIALVSLIVDANGDPVDVHMIESVEDSYTKNRDPKHLAAAHSLDLAALDAVEKCKFAPGTFHDKPVPIEIRVKVNFELF